VVWIKFGKHSIVCRQALDPHSCSEFEITAVNSADVSMDRCTQSGLPGGKLKLCLIP